jgi:hypothetical protein
MSYATDQTTSLSIARIVIGAASWVAPETALRLGLMNPSGPSSPFILRMFGAREVALGAVTLMAGPSTRPAMLKVGMAVDSADAAAGVLAIRSGALRPAVGAAMTGMAIAAIAAGAAGLGQQR